MTLLQAVTHTLVGTRSALALFAIGACVSWAKASRPRLFVEKLKSFTWGLLAASALLFAPTHIAWLVGRPLPILWGRTLDLVAALVACAGMIAMLGARAMMRQPPVPEGRVRKAMVANIFVVLGFVLLAWLVR